VPGEALLKLSSYDLPPEFAWAYRDPNVASALACFMIAAEEAGHESVDPEVHALVLRSLEDWTGKAPGLTNRWTEGALSTLPPEKRGAGRLALLTAMASYQVDEDVVTAFRAHQPSDRDLVNVTAWASYAAVRRIAQWLRPLTLRKMGGTHSGVLARHTGMVR
jgi:hypothetical protein